ncbi:MAG TPA: SDR family oxidoreductase [Gammaproteobacteria bacterium]|nr:SDR family oxidoreductase [Gammaproteobacteria bacterium]
MLVTGASRGIGRAIVDAVMAEGATVVGIARVFDQALFARERFEPVEQDLADLDRLPVALKALHQRFPKIDTLVCNAGFGRFGALEEFSAQQIRALIDLNLTSQILLVRQFLPALKRRGYGDIILMGSEAALAGGKRGAVYSATKFALRGFAQSLREECAGSKIRVTVINPGMVDSPFFETLSFRPDEADDCHLCVEDVAEAVLFVLSARSGSCIDEVNLSPQKKVIRFGPK